MFFMSLMNYSAVYFTFVQTEIRMLNVFLQDEAQAQNEMKILSLVKQIVKNHWTAIK